MAARCPFTRRPTSRSADCADWMIGAPGRLQLRLMINIELLRAPSGSSPRSTPKSAARL